MSFKQAARRSSLIAVALAFALMPAARPDAPALTLAGERGPFAGLRTDWLSHHDIVVKNTGTAPLHVTDMTLLDGGGEFLLDGRGCLGVEVAPGGECAFQVIFTPHWSGPHTATLKLYSDAPEGVTTLPISGTGLTPPVIVLDNYWVFSATTIGNQQRRRWTVRKGGQAPLRMYEARVVGENHDDFTVVGNQCSGRSLAQGQTCRSTSSSRRPARARSRRAHDGQWRVLTAARWDCAAPGSARSRLRSSSRRPTPCPARPPIPRPRRRRTS